MIDAVDYAEIVTEKPVQRFLQKFYLSDLDVQTLIIVSPFIGSLEGTRFALDRLNVKIEREKIVTYVITREPRPEDTYHRGGVEILSRCSFIELRFNPSVHAKLYVCIAREEGQSFGMFGSANLTVASIEKNIELGMMVYGRGRGRDILRELYQWGSIRLRTLPESRLVKRAQPYRRS